jgi:hypothetical protein
MGSDSPRKRILVRWWDDAGTSYAATEDHGQWFFYASEVGEVQWWTVQSTPQLIATAERLVSEGEHVREVSIHDGDFSEYLSRLGEQPSSSESASSMTRIKVFICYAKQDQDEASRLYRRLERAGLNPWMDKYRLVLGDNWKQEIERAVAEADVFLVCLRPGFDEIGFRHREVRWAMEALAVRPPSQGFIVPVVIEPCKLPDWCKPFHAGDHLTARTTFDELMKAIQKHSHG